MKKKKDESDELYGSGLKDAFQKVHDHRQKVKEAKLNGAASKPKEQVSGSSGGGRGAHSSRGGGKGKGGRSGGKGKGGGRGGRGDGKGKGGRGGSMKGKGGGGRGRGRGR